MCQIFCRWVQTNIERNEYQIGNIHFFRHWTREQSEAFHQEHTKCCHFNLIVGLQAQNAFWKIKNISNKPLKLELLSEKRFFFYQKLKVCLTHPKNTYDLYIWLHFIVEVPWRNLPPSSPNLLSEASFISYGTAGVNTLQVMVKIGNVYQ